MLTDFIIVDNIFANPDEIIEFAKKQQFIPRELHEDSKKSFYVGLRSKSIDTLSDEMYHKINTEIFTKCTEQIYSETSNRVTYGFGFQTSPYFHILYENEQPTDKWWHKDPDCIWAGVIYLNKNPRPNTGTSVIIDGKKVDVENKFNRLVMYSPTLEHSSQGGFGTGIDDCRLTLTFFVNAFQFKIKSIPNIVEA